MKTVTIDDYIKDQDLQQPAPSTIVESMNRIKRSFQVELIKEYDKLHFDSLGRHITTDEFDDLLSLSPAELQMKIAVKATVIDITNSMK